MCLFWQILSSDEIEIMIYVETSSVSPKNEKFADLFLPLNERLDQLAESNRRAPIKSPQQTWRWRQFFAPFSAC